MKFILPALLLLLFPLESQELSRRELRKETWKPAPPPEPQKGPRPPEYTVLESSRQLHREGLRNFHLGRFTDAMNCFALALEANPRSGDLILNYAFVSTCTPLMEGQSIPRAKALLKQLTRKENLKSDRYHLVDALIAWFENREDHALEQLEKVEAHHLVDPAQRLARHIRQGGFLVNHAWAKRVVPLRPGPREKRASR